MIGDSPSFRNAIDLLKRLAASDLPLFIRGETGTGKELAARLVHNSSSRKDGPYEVFDCGSVNRELINAALFGHVRGAFTNAHQDRTGCFERAHGGTLFLDEIGELPLDLQSNLLRVLEAREVRPVGGQQARPVDVRVVVATHRDLHQAVQDGQFRQDLYYRLVIAEVQLPALRDRPEDIAPLTAHFLQGVADWAPHPVNGFTPEAEAVLQSYPWPGNVRELKNVVLRCVASCGETGWIDWEVLQMAWPQGITAMDPDFVPPLDPEVPRFTGSLWEVVERHIEAVKRRYILWLIDECGGNQSAMARKADVDRKTISRLLKKYDLLALARSAPNR